ncbi:MAG TPA: GDSL-type esterase/lipase family protein [Tepidisphaeraceae bacterium]|jgi:hypothetical protein|nr:GDSL-type esterase/lipase family protein [Tepidisphaeraceae bacterium]
MDIFSFCRCPGIVSAVFAVTWVMHSAPEALAAPDPPAISASQPDHAENFTLRDHDVVAFLGGDWVVEELETGHFESLLAAAFPGRGVRFRNLGWEGDTVFEQPRDVNFPGVIDELKRVDAGVVFLQFGRQESRAGKDGIGAFVSAYEKLCDAVGKQSPKMVLVTPPPDDQTPGVDPHARAADLRLYASAIRELANRRGYACADIFSELGGANDAPASDPLTEHGTPTARGAARVALAEARQLGLGATADAATKGKAPANQDGRWNTPPMEALRQAIVAKNRLWFRYRRPTNWAFLGGDRTSVPSSHDHRDPSVRWFPAEMEQYVPLIEQAEARADELARAAREAR